MALFDFKDFLDQLQPIPECEITTLKHGPLTATARATVIKHNKHPNFCKIRSLILKHALPTLEWIQLELEFHVLGHFSANKGWKHICKSSGIRVPKLYNQFSGAQVMAFEDLGPVCTLWDILSPKTFEGSDLSFRAIWGIGSGLGSRVGHFLAILGSANTTKEFLSLSRQLKPPIDELIATRAFHRTKEDDFSEQVASIREPLTKFAVDGEELYQRVAVAFHQPPPLGFLTHGDCHPENILLPDWSVLAKQAPGEQPLIAIVNWGLFKTNGRAVDGDITQLIAHLYCHAVYVMALYLSLGEESEQDAKQASKAKELVKAEHYCLGFIDGLTQKYSEVLLNEYYRPEMEKRLLRSTLLVLGREVINQAYKVKWDLRGFAVTLNELRAQLVEAGAVFLRCAGNNEHDAAMSWFDDKPECLKKLFHF